MLGCELRFPHGGDSTPPTAVSASAAASSSAYGCTSSCPPPSQRVPPRRILGGRPRVEVDWLAGAFMLLRSELFEQSSGFDERFSMYGEDSEWCMRLRRMGHRIIYSPAAGTVFTRRRGQLGLWCGAEKDRLRRCSAASSRTPP